MVVQFIVLICYYLKVFYCFFMLYQYYISFPTFYCSKSTLNFYHIYIIIIIVIRLDFKYQYLSSDDINYISQTCFKVSNVLHPNKPLILAENFIKIK